MKRVRTEIYILLSATAVLTSCKKQPELDYQPPSGISWSSVLRNVANLQTVSEPVQDWERSLHFSSSATTGKVILAHLAQEIQGDMDHGFFMKVIEHSQGVDATLAEVNGRGMISWVWSANPTGILRLFIDNRDTPAIEMSFKDFLTGRFLPTSDPFAAFTANGYNLHFPLIHSQYVRMDVRVPNQKDLATLYYQIAWNAVSPLEPIHAFSPGDVLRGKSILHEIADTLRQRGTIPSDVPSPSLVLPAGQSLDLFSSTTGGTISNILLHTDQKDELGALYLTTYWDNARIPSLACPLHLLAGTSERMEDVQSFPTEVKGSTVSIRWPMPFRTAKIVIRNISNNPIRIVYHIQTSAQIGSNRFMGHYSKHLNLRTENQNVLTLAESSGSGRLVACNIQVISRTKHWWGEGDQLIFLDSSEEPTWRGTGTEDYFGFAWCSRDTFNHVFRGQSAVFETRTGRISAMHRYHLLDSLPYHHFAKFQTEAWGLAEGSMDYASLILFYTRE